MRLHNEFEVAVPLEQAWAALLDLEQMAGFLPGATIEPGDEPNVYNGAMKVKVGPISVAYSGSARLGEVDDDAHTVEIVVNAREARGQGTASATISNSLLGTERGTRVVAETELDVTGRQAQFGRGIMEDVAGRVMSQFARRFEEHLRGSTTNQPPAPKPEPGGSSIQDALDLGALLPRGTLRRCRGAALTVSVGLLLGAVMRRRARRRRHRLTLVFDRSWLR